MRVSRLTLRPLLLAGTFTLLAACGSDEPAGSETVVTGTLTDSAITGVQYSTSSGQSGKTDADGKFRYVPGDTVTFRLGTFQLGRITADGEDETVTPIQLIGNPDGVDAATRADLVTNLLVLLQSLDVDGNPNNGINIPDAVATALTLAVANDLGNALAGTPDAFDDAGTNPALATLVAAAGGSAAIRSKEDALAHFKYRFMLELPGTYLLRQGGDVMTLRFDYSGNYLMGSVGTAGGGGQSGIERGQISWNPASGEITVVADSIDRNSNGSWGFSSLGSGDKAYLALDGGDLLLRSTDDSGSQTLRLTRVGNSSTTLLGAFAAYQGDGSATSFGVPQFIFLGDGRYVLVDPQGTRNYTVAYDSLCTGGAGIEYGSYVFSSGQLVVTNIDEDTNGCAGLHDDDTNSRAVWAPLTVSRDAGGVYQGSTESGTRVMTYPRYLPLL
jgi:hypothetical protein